jgi:hypothetical protein
MGDRIPEGHRAPVIELLWPRRTVKTQTFNSDIDYDQDNDNIVGYNNTADSITNSEDSCPSSDISRSESPISPAGIPFISLQFFFQLFNKSITNYRQNN